MDSDNQKLNVQRQNWARVVLVGQSHLKLSVTDGISRSVQSIVHLNITDLVAVRSYFVVT